jgi:hypothetical protein
VRCCRRGLDRSLVGRIWMRIQGPGVRLPQAPWLCSFLHAYNLDATTAHCVQKEPAMLFNNSSVTPFEGHLTSRKLLHMDALSIIPRGLAIKMKTAQHASIGLNYGPIGRKYWTTNSLAFTLKVSIWNGSLRNPRSHGRVAENGLAARQSSKGIRKF